MRIFASIGARFELGRTRLEQALLAHARGDRESATVHVGEAYAQLKPLEAPRYLERIDELAARLNVPLA